MTDAEFAKYVPRLLELKRQGFSPSRAAAQVLAEEVVTDDRDRVMRTEVFDVDPRDRAKIAAGVAYGAGEMRIPVPRIRFFKSAGLSFRGTHYRDWNEIWVAADKPLHEQGFVALHELRHVEHYLTDTPHELREADADRYAAAHRHWI